MAHVYHEEEQRFSSLRWIWMLMLLIMLIPVAMISSGIEKMGQEELLATTISVLIAFIPMIGMFLFSKLQVKINDEGIHYKFFPATMKWRAIPKNNIKSFEVSEKKGFFEKIECGYRNNRFKKCIVMNISGEKFARIKLTDGRKFKIGSTNPESMERALRKLTSPDND